jgi:serine protease AprX
MARRDGSCDIRGVRLLRGLVAVLVGAGALAAPGVATGDTPAHVALVGLAIPPDAAMVAALEATGVVVAPLRHVPAAVVRGSAEALGAVARVPGVVRVDLDRPLATYLDRTVAQIGAASVRDDLGIDGTGVTVAVVDSGIDATHPDLAFGTKVVQNVKVLGEEHLAPGVSLTVEGVADTDTTSGHGTHVGGIVAGDGTASAGRYRGVAPGARLVGVGSGEGVSMVTAAVGLDWVIANRDRYGIKVVNNSWGDGSVPYDPDDTLNRATKAVHDAGITVVMAAGNDGAYGAGRISRYCIPDWVICVGASTKTGRLADLSSWGDPADPVWWPDVLAPGMWVASARAATGAVSDANSVPMDLTDPADPQVMPVELWTRYTVLSGTSMAAPHVAGVVALLLQANPRLSPDAVREVLRRTARPTDGCPPHACGAGQVDARAAVDLVRSVKNVKKFTSRKWGWEFWGAERVVTWTGTVGASVLGAAHDLHVVDVPADADSLDVTVSWSSTVNDLDLTLRRPDGTPAATSVTSLTQAGPDKAEVVLVGGPAPGSWVADVSGFVSVGQPYRATASVVTPL